MLLTSQPQRRRYTVATARSARRIGAARNSYAAEIKGSGSWKLSQAPFRKHPISQACSLAVATTRYARGDLGTPLLDEDKAGCQGTGGGQATTMVPTPFTSSSMVPSSSAEQV